VAPFQTERFSSVSLLEAMAQGKPLIATNIGEQQEIVQDGTNGYLVSMDDSGELPDRIVGLLSNPGKLQQFSSAARSTAEKRGGPRRLDRDRDLISEIF